MIITFIIYGISVLFAYLNSGADRSNMLNTEIQKIEHYTPTFIWDDTPNEGRIIDSENLNQIKDDYLDAWYVKHVAFKTNSTSGIADYYTESARENLTKIIAQNTSENITIEATTLEHHPKLEFFSEDGQLAVLTDHNVVEYKRVFANNTLLKAYEEASTYQIILLLEDGFWRIRHLVKTAQKLQSEKQKDPIAYRDKIKGINYYPKASPWNMFGDQFSKDTIAQDFNIIKDSGLNTVRLFIQYEAFGSANVDLNKLQRVQETLDAAYEANLKVFITLFDFYGNYEVSDWTLTRQHAETIVNALKSHKALLGWDIKNEPDLDFESRGEFNVTSWLKQMAQHIKTLDSVHPITIGWSNPSSATILKEELDLITFHYYNDLNELASNVNNLKSEIGEKPLILGEFGLSSFDGFWNPMGSDEDDQAEYHKKAQNIISNLDLNAMSWTLYDFETIPEAVVGSLPWRQQNQKYFGFLDQEGNPKPSFEYISSE